MVLTAQFGDGYNQRTPDGINNIVATWQVQWDNLLDSDANSIDSFLIGKAGATAFLWTPPGESSALKWVCASWSRAPRDFVGRSTMQATFEQVFDL